MIDKLPSDLVMILSPMNASHFNMGMFVSVFSIRFHHKRIECIQFDYRVCCQICVCVHVVTLISMWLWCYG